MYRVVKDVELDSWPFCAAILFVANYFPALN